MKTMMRTAAVGAMWLMAVLSAGPARAIVYNVNTDFGGGASVTGYIETDDTLGILAAGNITDWSLTLTSANLGSGSPFSFSYAGNRTEIGGTAVTATATELLFDFTAPTQQYIILQNQSGPGNFLCLVNTTGCGVGSGLSIGFGTVSTEAEHLAITSDSYVFASTGTSVAVPEPGALAVLGAGLFGLGISRRARTPRRIA